MRTKIQKKVSPCRCTYVYRAFFHSVMMFCHGRQYNLRGPASAVDSSSISPPAEGTFKNVTFQTLRQSGKNTLYYTHVNVQGASAGHQLCFVELKLLIRVTNSGGLATCKSIQLYFLLPPSFPATWPT